MSPQNVLAAPPLIPSTRFTLALLISTALFILYAQRVSLSMGIVCMVNRTNINTVLNSTSYSDQIVNKTSPTSSNYRSQFLKEKRFFLTESQQQILLGAYWFGYIFTLAAGGWLAAKIGAKRVFTISLILSSIATVAMALLYFVHGSYFIVAVILRILTGIGHGPLFPVTYTFLSVWAVPIERGTLTSIAFCSPNLGTSITMLLGGVFCRYVSSGWVYIFLLTGIVGFMWLPFWLWLIANSPQTHRTISEKERNYICQLIGNDANDKAKKLPPLPWKKAIRSKPIIALLITQFCCLFGLFFFLTNVGKILTEIHRVPTQIAGYILAGGFLLMPISSLLTGIIADRLVRAKKISLTNVRKLFNSLTAFIPAACMVVLCFCDHTRQILGVLSVLIFLIASAMAYGSGFVVNFGDVVPAYSSIIFGVGSAISTVGALLSNLIASIIIKRPILEDWRKLFILFTIMYTLGGVIYLIFGSAVPRKWATFKPETSKQNEEIKAITMLPRQTNGPST